MPDVSYNKPKMFLVKCKTFSQKLPMTFDICHMMDVDPKTDTVTHGPLVNSTCDMGKLSDRDIQRFF